MHKVLPHDTKDDAIPRSLLLRYLVLEVHELERMIGKMMQQAAKVAT